MTVPQLEGPEDPRVNPTRPEVFWENDRAIKRYLRENERIFAELHDLRELGWDQKDGDAFFEERRQRADSPTKPFAALQNHLNMMRNVGIELHDTTEALTPYSLTPNTQMRILDLCMAPGGFTSAALHHNPFATVDAITLPPRDGGSKVLVRYGRNDPRVRFLLADVTMFATEFGAPPDSIPPEHPDVHAFFHTNPFSLRQYDLIFCDGQVLRMHKRGAHREKREATRLTNAQLILALQRIRPRGTLVMLLHKIEAWDTVLLLHMFSAFSEVEVFKPKRCHAIRSSFYMVAKEVQPRSEAAKRAIERFKTLWKQATFSDCEYDDEVGDAVDGASVVIREFGEAFRDMGRCVWTIQKEALEKAPFMVKE